MKTNLFYKDPLIETIIYNLCKRNDIKVIGVTKEAGYDDKNDYEMEIEGDEIYLLYLTFLVMLYSM